MVLWTKGILSALAQDFAYNIKPFGSCSAAPQAQLMMGAHFPSFHIGVSISRKESQTLENNFREILFLIEQIDVLKALLRDTQEDLHSYSWNTDQDEDQDPMEATDEVGRLGGAHSGACGQIQGWLLCGFVLLLNTP